MRLDLDFRGEVSFSRYRRDSCSWECLTLRAGLVDDTVRAFYTESHCYYLAAAMAAMTGWDVLSLVGNEPGLGWRSVHTAVISPYGQALDILGQYDSEVAAEEYWEHRTGLSLNAYRMPVENMPIHTAAHLSDRVGDRFWWADGEPEVAAVHQHFARWVLTRHGYGYLVQPE